MMKVASFAMSLAGHVGVAIAAVWLVPRVVAIYEPLPLFMPVPASKVELAMVTLRQSERLYAAQIGYAGIAPAELLAWRLIWYRRDADSLFLELTRGPSRVGQAYGLIGLYTVNRELYQKARQAAARDGSTVPTMVGCIGWDQPMATLLGEIDQGVWSREFVSGRLER